MQLTDSPRVTNSIDMAKVTRTTAGARFLANKEKFNAKFVEFNVNERIVGREERKAMKERLAEYNRMKNAPKTPVTTGLVKSNLKFAYSL